MNHESNVILIFSDNEKITEILIDKGSYINYKNSQGTTALHHAVIHSIQIHSDSV